MCGNGTITPNFIRRFTFHVESSRRTLRFGEKKKILNILLIFKNLKNNIAVLVFLVGLASRLIMGFSPTVFASAMRTNLFLDFSMLITTLLIWQEFKKKTDKNEKKVQRRIYFTIKILAIFQYANALVGILLTQK